MLSLQSLLLFKSMLTCAALAFVTHYMACYWYACGDMGLQGGNALIGQPEVNWIERYHLVDVPVLHVYAASYHWALGQSGFAPTRIQATNDFEHVVTCGMGFAWIIMIAVVISFFMQWMAEHRKKNQDEHEQRMKLNKYCDENDVTPALRHKVLRNFLWTYQHVKRRVHEADIDFFIDLQPELKFKLRNEVYMPILRTHPIFEFMEKCNEDIMHSVANLAVGAHRYLAGETVFKQGHSANRLYHIRVGCCEYCSSSGQRSAKELVAGNWALEPALFSKWRTKGQLVAKSSSELVIVDVRRLEAIVSDAETRGDVLTPLRSFASGAITYFKNTVPDSDLWGNFEVLHRLGEQYHPEVCERSDATMSAALHRGLRAL